MFMLLSTLPGTLYTGFCSWCNQEVCSGVEIQLRVWPGCQAWVATVWQRYCSGFDVNNVWGQRRLHQHIQSLIQHICDWRCREHSRAPQKGISKLDQMALKRIPLIPLVQGNLPSKNGMFERQNLPPASVFQDRAFISMTSSQCIILSKSWAAWLSSTA